MGFSAGLVRAIWEDMRDIVHEDYWCVRDTIFKKKNDELLIDMMEAEPLDLLGPAHQRLFMHCLSEVAGYTVASGDGTEVYQKAHAVTPSS